ncbi:hypothetical protein ACJX0J_001493 (mitochondrion) [Zea mays]
MLTKQLNHALKKEYAQEIKQEDADSNDRSNRTTSNLAFILFDSPREFVLVWIKLLLTLIFMLLISALPYPERGKQFFFVIFFLATALRVIEVKVTWEIKESVAVAGKKIREYRDDPLVPTPDYRQALLLEGSPREGHYFFREEPYFYQLEKHLISWQKSNPLSRGIACAFRGIASNIGNKSYKGILDTPDARKALGDEWFLIQTRPICLMHFIQRHGGGNFLSKEKKEKHQNKGIMVKGKMKEHKPENGNSQNRNEVWEEIRALGLEEKEDERYPFTERAANIKQLSSLKLQKVLFSFSDIDGCVQNGMIPFLMFSFMLKEQENVRILRGLKILFCLGLKILTDELKEIEMIHELTKYAVSYQARASWVGGGHEIVFAFLSKRGVGLTKPHANDMFLILIDGGESFEVQERWGGTLIWQEYETSIFDDPEGFKKGGGQGNETSTSLSPTCVPFTEKLIKSLSLHKTVMLIEEKDQITRKRTREIVHQAIRKGQLDPLPQGSQMREA